MSIVFLEFNPIVVVEAPKEIYGTLPSTSSIQTSRWMSSYADELNFSGYDFNPQESDLFKDRTAVIIFCYNRVPQLEQTLDAVISNLPQGKNNQEKMLFFVSQDGEESPEVDELARKKLDIINQRGFLTAKFNHKAKIPPRNDDYVPFQRLNSNYRFGLNKAFREYGAKRVIVLEDDMEIASDFFSYFGALSPLLDLDSTLYSISSWNDHGQEQFTEDNEKLHRTDYFPGLGWMLTTKLWDELEPKWPDLFWDDWMRKPKNRLGRQSISPEISRNFNLGLHSGTTGAGSHKSLFEQMRKVDHPVNFTELDLGYLQPKVHDENFVKGLNAAKKVAFESLEKELAADKPQGSFKIIYIDIKGYKKIAKLVGISDNIREGVARQAYMGVVFVRYNGHNLYIAPRKLKHH